jgi:hypothetical protein
MESWVFNKKEIRFIADLITAGGKVGFPYNISRVFRSKKNLLITFMNPDNSVTIKNGDSSYRLLKKYEIRQYQYTDYPSGKQIKYEEKSQYELRINKSAFSRKNRNTRDIEAPSDAWYQITNTGKSDLLVFVADQSLTERKVMSL